MMLILCLECNLLSLPDSLLNFIALFRALIWLIFSIRTLKRMILACHWVFNNNKFTLPHFYRSAQNFLACMTFYLLYCACYESPLGARSYMPQKSNAKRAGISRDGT